MSITVIEDIATANKWLQRQGIGTALIKQAAPMLKDYISAGCLYLQYSCLFVAHESQVILPYACSSSHLFRPARSSIVDRIAGAYERELLLDNLQYNNLLDYGVKFMRMR